MQNPLNIDQDFQQKESLLRPSFLVKKRRNGSSDWLYFKSILFGSKINPYQHLFLNIESQHEQPRILFYLYTKNSSYQPHFSMMIFRSIDKLKNDFEFFLDKITSIHFQRGFPYVSLFFFLGILNSKQIAATSLFSYPLRIKTPFFKNITNNSVIILWKLNV